MHILKHPAFFAWCYFTSLQHFITQYCKRYPFWYNSFEMLWSSTSFLLFIFSLLLAIASSQLVIISINRKSSSYTNQWLFKFTNIFINFFASCSLHTTSCLVSLLVCILEEVSSHSLWLKVSLSLFLNWVHVNQRLSKSAFCLSTCYYFLILWKCV